MNRCISNEEAQSFANKNGLDYFEMSAKSNINTNVAFDSAVKAGIGYDELFYQLTEKELTQIRKWTKKNQSKSRWFINSILNRFLK